MRINRLRVLHQQAVCQHLAIGQHTVGQPQIPRIHRYGEHNDAVDCLDTEVPANDKSTHKEQDGVDDKDKLSECDGGEYGVKQHRHTCRATTHTASRDYAGSPSEGIEKHS